MLTYGVRPAMKIVVYNSHRQYALSRAEAEAIWQVLPEEYTTQVRELHLAHSHPRQKQQFEFDERQGIAYLIVPVEQKSPEQTTQAIAELLVGLARINAKSHFFLPLKPKERAMYQEFLQKWLPLCEKAVTRLHTNTRPQ